MKPLSYIDYRKYYANHCSICEGDGRVIEDGIRKECLCQKKARRKYRLEQIDIYPPELKYKDWTDFTGIITKNNQVTGNLKIESTVVARNKAFNYCYGVDFNENLLKTRLSSVKVHTHLEDGQNVVIAGDESTGRSLLGAIICKEVANASILINRDLDYRWIRFYDILNAARWVFDANMHKPVNHPYLDMLANLDFLFIDGLDIQRGKNYPADHVAMDVLFGTRTLFHLPTILVCSRKVLKLITSSMGQDQLSSLYGYEFVKMLKKPNTVIIELIKENNKVTSKLAR
jgi:hypothetical protein